MIDSIAKQMSVNIAKGNLNNKEEDLKSRLRQEYKSIIEHVMIEFERLDGLVAIAFDFESNSKVRFDASINLAREINVEEIDILKNIDDIDNFFLN